jgi:2-methylcitrate dehydratase PrpD
MIASSKQCEDRFKIMTSLPYALAMTANRIPSGPKWWKEEVFSSTEYRKFMDRVSHVVNPDLNAPLIEDVKKHGNLIAGHIPMLVEVMARGSVYKKDVFIAHGDPLGPPEAWMTDDELRVKAREFCSELLPDQATEALIVAAFDLDHENGINALIGAISGSDLKTPRDFHSLVA